MVERDLPKVDVEGSNPFSRSKRSRQPGRFLFFYHCRMHFRNLVSASLLAAITLCTATSLYADDRSMWQKFKDFFSPSPTVVGDGPEYDELRELDKKIGTLEGKYSRERRANNKKYIREEIDKLKLQREKLAKQIEEKEKAAKNAPKSSATVSSSSKTADAATKPACAHDTVFVHDTVTVHDTLYVIVSGKPGEQQAPAAPADSAAKPAADSATVPGNK